MPARLLKVNMNDGTDNNSQIVGRVVDVRGRGIAGASVVCNDLTTSTLCDGRFKVSNVTPSTYLITVKQKGFRDQSTTIDVDRGVASVRFTLHPEQGTSTIHGYVFASDGTPLTAGGTMFMAMPVENVHVEINPLTGYYAFHDLVKGAYTVWPSILGYDDEIKKVTLRENEQLRVDFHCRKIESIQPPWG